MKKNVFRIGLVLLIPLFFPYTVRSSMAGVLPQTNWRLWYVDSEESVGENGVAENAFDGSAGTFWHTQWAGGNPPPPHEIQIDLAGNYTIDGFRYLPRQDADVNGTIRNYEFYVSVDGINWGSPVASGTFANTKAVKEVLFTAKSGRYVRLRALSEVNGNPWTSAAELNVLGNGTPGNQAPNGVIDAPTQNMTINLGDSITFSGTGTDPDGNLPLSFRWNFGAGSGIPDSTVEDPGPIRFSNPGVFTVTFTVTDAQGLPDPTPATRLITVLGGTGGGVIPQTNWRLMYVDSQEAVGENGVATNAFDGSAGTFWHTQWAGGNPPPPHEIQIDLAGNYTINGFRYLPRQDADVNGTIRNYEFYVSVDGINWGSPVASGTFANTKAVKEVLFTAKSGRYVRLRALSEVNGNPWTSAAELNVLGNGTPGNQAPNGVIDAPTQNMTINLGDSVTFSGTGTDPDGNLPLSFRWNFGAGSGIPDSTVEDPGPIRFSNPGVFTVTFTVTDAQGLPDPTPATRLITVPGGTGGGVIPQTNWRLRYVDSENTVWENGVAKNAFDGSAGTFWHTQWAGGNPPPPHEIQIDLAGNYTIDGFRYLPRQDVSENGTIRNYEFYVSGDGINWGSSVASGTFANTKAVKEVLFTAKSGRYVRLRALSEVNGNPWTSVAELNVLGNGTATGDSYVAVGDSITAGSHDDIPADGTGYEPILSNLLSVSKGYPNTIANAGVSGTRSADGAASISSTLATYPTAKYYLIMYGTNDATLPPIPSGRGLIPGDPGYFGSFKDNMQRIISAILAAGKIPYLAEVPYTSDPLRSNAMIFEYNAAIDELVLTNNILVTPPSFYAWFQSHTSQLADGIHPNGTGYQSMANLWFNALP